MYKTNLSWYLNRICHSFTSLDDGMKQLLIDFVTYQYIDTLNTKSNKY
jgi:hypothetical protein